MKAPSAPQLQIRDTTFEDIPEFRAMHRASWRYTYPNGEHGVSKEWVEKRTAEWLTSEGLEKSREYFKNIIGKGNHLHKLAVVDGKIEGFVHIFKKNSGDVHLGALYVAASSHGKGVAQKLMAAALTWAQNADVIDLEVATYNHRAQAFYRKFGFKEKPGSEHLFAEMIPVITMERKKGESNEI